MTDWNKVAETLRWLNTRRTMTPTKPSVAKPKKFWILAL